MIAGILFLRRFVMSVQVSYADCPSCSFPVAGQPGQSVTCPNCGISGTISGIEIPGPIFWGGLGILIGFVLGKSKYVGEQFSRI